MRAVRLYRTKNGRHPSVTAVARELGVDWQTVSIWLQEEGVKIHRTRYDHKAIAAEIKTGRRSVDISRQYGCSWWLVENIKKKMKRGEL